MGIIKNPAPVKLFIGMLSNEPPLFGELAKELTVRYGTCDLEGPVWPWEHTAYYKEEMGEHLKRKFIFFQKLIEPAALSRIKLETNTIEQRYLNSGGRRRINLDPGYLDSAKLVLVSTKDYSHRIYLDNGIYGEVTLIYSKTDYEPLPYTYRDYRSEEYRSLFRQARALYKQACHSA